MTDKKQGYQPEIGIETSPPNCTSGVTPPNNNRVLIFIPNDANYIEILGHRIDGFESFEAFLEHLEKYVVLEETVKIQKAEVERLVKILDDKCDRCIEKERTEAVKEFANELYRVFAGHSDYHGDTILTKIACLAEGKAIKCAEPIDTNNIKAEAVKEFAERVKSRLITVTYINFDDIIDNLVKEMVGEG